jgi:hypothetical protein
MQLETAKSDYFKYANDLMQNNSSKKSDNSTSLSFKNILGEYYGPNLFAFKINPLNDVSNNFGTYRIESLLYSPHLSPEQPPDSITT